MSQLDIEAIKNLKHRYFRLLDQKRFDDLAELLLPDCAVSYHNGRYGHPDRASTIDFLKAYMSSTQVLTLHQGHHPEITLLSDNEATGIWYLHDIVINLAENTKLEGNGFYEDTYRKVNGEWKISHTGYRRTFDLKQPLGEVLELFNGFVEDGPF
jgi:SnoaL-like protein